MKTFKVSYLDQRSLSKYCYIQAKDTKKVFMTEQERLLMETAIAYYRDFEP
jgi:hypothetical protein